MGAISLHAWEACIFLIFLCSCVEGQNGSCVATRSNTSSGFYDITCGCGQTLNQKIDRVDLLTIDSTECQSQAALEISWKDLEKATGPRSILFLGGVIILPSPPAQSWVSSIDLLTFERCSFDSIPPNAFAGLTSLTELRFVNNYVGNLSSGAISNLPSLETIEFAACDIIEISSMAISSLPQLHELAFTYANIGYLRSNALENLRTPELPTNSNCPEIDIRHGSARDNNVMNSVMDRSLESVEDVPLPETGARLHFYHNNISVMEKFALKSQLFSFIIFYGNNVSHLETGAFSLEISNQCEISAAMIVKNIFASVRPGALAYIQGITGVSHATYLVLTDNTFQYVADKGFLFHPSVQVYSVADNKFVCTCHFFEWLRYPANSSRQREIEGDLKTNATCENNSVRVETFTGSCKDAHPMPTTTSWYGLPTEYEIVTLSQSQSSAHALQHIQGKTFFACFIVIITMNFVI